MQGLDYLARLSDIPEVISAGKLRVRTAGPMRMERHDDAFEILYLSVGRKEMEVAGKNYSMSGGDALLIFPGEEHGKMDDVQNRSQMTFALISDPMRVERFCGLTEAQRGALSARLHAVSQRIFKATPEFARLINRLYEALECVDELREARVRALVVFLIEEIIQSGSADRKSVPDDIAQAIAYIRENRTEMPSVGELSEIARLSEPRFKQKFKQATGVPPAEYITREKVAEAKKMLRASQVSIIYIAMELGFSSSQHFAVLFKKYAGCTPGQYRSGKAAAYLPNETDRG